MKDDIITRNAKGELHGYVELHIDKGCWLKAMFNDDDEIGYCLDNRTIDGIIDDDDTEVRFHIR